MPFSRRQSQTDGMMIRIESGENTSVLLFNLESKYMGIGAGDGTDLAADYAAGRFSCLTLEEYGTWLRTCLQVLPPETVVHRITGDGAKRDLIAPLWSGDKKRVLNYLNSVIK